jgi:hypothetical protein
MKSPFNFSINPEQTFLGGILLGLVTIITYQSIIHYQHSKVKNLMDDINGTWENSVYQINEASSAREALIITRQFNEKLKGFIDRKKAIIRDNPEFITELEALIRKHREFNTFYRNYQLTIQAGTNIRNKFPGSTALIKATYESLELIQRFFKEHW